MQSPGVEAPQGRIVTGVIATVLFCAFQLSSTTRWDVANAYRQTYRCKKTGRKMRTKTYRVEYRDADGFRRTCPGGPDYKSAMQLGSDLEREAAKVKVGGVSSFRES